MVNMDYSMFKSFPIRERMSLQLRFEAFNLFNFQNYDVPSSVTVNTGNPSGSPLLPSSAIAAGAGKVTALAQGTNPRQLQFGLRFEF